MKCKRCGSEENSKNGKRKGKQCYVCKKCKHQFVSEQGRHSQRDVEMAVSLYCLGLSFRTIAKLFYVHNTTIMRWVRQYAEEHYEKPLVNGEIVVELDEMWHFIQSKKSNAGFGKHIAEQLDSFLIGNAETEAVRRFKNC